MAELVHHYTHKHGIFITVGKILRRRRICDNSWKNNKWLWLEGWRFRVLCDHVCVGEIMGLQKAPPGLPLFYLTWQSNRFVKNIAKNTGEEIKDKKYTIAKEIELYVGKICCLDICSSNIDTSIRGKKLFFTLLSCEVQKKPFQRRDGPRPLTLL